VTIQEASLALLIAARSTSVHVGLYAGL
jgi:hypothetical protein